MNSLWASLKSYLPPSRTSRQRYAVAGGALLLLAGLCWGLWVLLSPQKVDYEETWFSLEFTTDNQAHPLHLTLPDGREGIFDLMAVENSSDQPLSLLPFSSRPRIAGLSADQTMSAWAQWIAASRQGIIVEPHSTWFLDPADLDRLPAIHGHTWICVFFSKAPSASASRLPATVLPPAFQGRFRVHFCLSQLPEHEITVPQMHRSALVQALQDEADVSGKTFRGAPSHGLNDLVGPTGLGIEGTGRH